MKQSPSSEPNIQSLS